MADAPEPGDLLCIVPGPTDELRRKPLGDLWCFECRKRLPHDLMMFDYDEDSPHHGYYDPVVIRQCSRCHQDHTAFPGSVW